MLREPGKSISSKGAFRAKAREETQRLIDLFPIEQRSQDHGTVPEAAVSSDELDVLVAGSEVNAVTEESGGFPALEPGVDFESQDGGDKDCSDSAERAVVTRHIHKLEETALSPFSEAVLEAEADFEGRRGILHAIEGSADAILAAAGISQEDLCQDTLCPNLQQNIMIASTPKRENASRYVRMRQILISGKVHELSAYETTPHSTCKGVIRNIPLQDGPDVIDAKIVNTNNPLALAAKRIAQTGTKQEAIALLGRHGPRGREAPRGDDLRRDSHHANELEKLRRDNEQLRKENARVKQEMSRLAVEMAEIRKLALSPSPAQPASVPVPVAMDTSEASHGSSATKRRAVENRQEDETIKLLSELNNAVASMQASLKKVQAAIAHPKMGLGALSERISKLEEVDARPAPSQVAVQRNVLAPLTEGAILRAALSAQPSPQPRNG
ncbi:hypothetical protein HPB49_009955 [Dermacentor silvarum]|uniref:Uncharacterized protein n=1 Tax=Dermacentor silvarum TaxID=543639 RepID=A0ACB8DZ09_DERSI|nr:hypothetical protein HPB49_009955 [Dermacentor silvarum]